MSFPGNPRGLARKGLARSTVVLLLAFGFVPLCILSILFFTFYFEGQKQAIRDVQRELAERLALGISSYLEKTTSQIRLFARMVTLEGMGKKALEHRAHDILDRWLEYDTITVMDLEGNEVSKVSRYYTFTPSELGNQSLELFFGSALAGRTHIGEVEISLFSKFPHIRITVPIMDLKDRPAGVLGVEVNITRMWELISRYRIGEERYAYVVDSRGVLIAYREVSSVLQKKDLKDIQGVGAFLAGDPGTREYKGMNRERVIGSSAKIPLVGWGVLVEQPAGAAYRDLHMLSLILLSILGLTAACAVTLGFRFSVRNIVGPVRRLQEEASLIAKGDLDRRIRLERPDELGQLAESFNTMVADLQKTVVSRELLARTERLAHIGSWQGDNRSKTLDWSDETYRIFGRDPSLGPPSREEFWKAVHPEDAQGFLDCIVALRSHGMPFRRELRILHPDGTTRYVLAEGTAVRDGAGAVERIHGFVLDMTERKLAEEALRESEEKYRDLVENINEVIYSVDEKGTVTYVSPVIEQEFGYRISEIVGRPLTDFACPEDVPQILSRFQEILNGDRSLREYRLLTRSGQIRWVRSSSRPLFKEGVFIGLTGSFTDITERKHLETQLRQAQKMEALGTMAGGIAHDFNNILGIIVGNTELAMLEIPESSPMHRHLVEVRKASLRARDLVREILSFSRQAEPARRAVSLRRILDDSLRFLRSSIPAHIEIRQRVECDRDTVLADPTQLNQVLLNLCTNAAYVMREKGGILEIRLSDVKLDRSEVSPYPDLKPGGYVRMSVSDTGPGIGPGILERIFDPYFTTKPVGEGTGLGLAVVHGIVKGHGGAVSVESRPGKGATFHVLLPKSEGEPEAKASPVESLPRGGERILFVDDERMIVRALESMLEKLGYRVLGMTDSTEALRAFQASPEGFDLVITDQTMPGLTGQALSKALMAIRPDISIILCTGFSDLIDEAKARAMGIKAFVMKPVVLKEIARTIREVLDEKVQGKRSKVQGP